MAWGGVFGFPYPTNLNLVSAWEFFIKFLLNSNLSSFEWYRFPLGFRGVEPMHGNIGYAACQTISLLCASFLFAWIQKSTKNYMLSFLGIVICLASMLIASSRGSILFAFLIIILAICIFFIKIKYQKFNINKFRANKQIFVSLAIFFTLAWGVLFLTQHVIKNDIRWQTMLDKIGIGWSLTDPTFILCEGLAESDKESIRQNFKNHAPDYVEEIIAGVESQDGARILLMRAGIELVIENPFGVDGARSTYMQLITTKCGHEPRLSFAHLHHSWMDMALALGWVGVVIFAWLLLSCLLMGWRGLNSDAAAPWAFALFLLSAFWFIRGFADSLYREHFLQMQAFIMAYLYTRVAAAIRD
jgi:O-antigen ligase